MFDAMVAAVRGAVSSLEPSRLNGAEAARLLEVFTTAERLCAAARTMLSSRIAETKVWQREGHRTPAEWIATKTGVSSGQALGVLETARNLDESPLTKDAFINGQLSEVQAREISTATAADPRAERSLLEHAHSDGFKGLREECQRVRAAAVPDELVRYEQIRRSRFFRSWTDHDGSLRFAGRLTPDSGGQMVAGVDARAEYIFREARAAGRREPREAYAADALVQLVAGSDTGSRSGPKAMVHVLVDHAALVRGNVQNGERCEIGGVGPIPVASARAFGQDAIIKAVALNGTQVQLVSHDPGRSTHRARGSRSGLRGAGLRDAISPRD